MSARYRYLAVVMLALFFCPPVQSQDADVIKVDVALVTVNVSVTDSKHRPVPDLQAEDFLVHDQDKLVQLEFFDRYGPASIVLVVDISTSMGGDKWRYLKAGLKKFLATARENNDYTLIAFSDRPQLIARAVSADQLWRHLNTLDPSGHTALNDGVLLGLDVLEKVPQRHRALVLFSDGQDNSSQATLPEVQQAVLARRATIYTVGILLGEYELPGLGQAGRELLKQLASISGGQVHFPRPPDIRKTLEQISADVRSQYSLSYYPPDKTPGCRRILVNIRDTRQLDLRYQERYVMRSNRSQPDPQTPFTMGRSCWDPRSRKPLSRKAP